MHNLSKHPVEEALAKIKNVFVVMSGKGGVGKSTVSANLAVSLKNKGYKTAVLDADIHGPSMFRMFGIDGERLAVDEDKYIIPIEKDGLKVMSVAGTLGNEGESTILRGPIKIGVITQFISDARWGELDYLIIDLPPGTGDEPLTVAQTVENAQAVIVTTPQEVSIIDVKKSVDFCRKLNIPISGVIENMGSIVCPDCGKIIPLFPGHGGEKLAAEYSLPFLGSLPFESAVSAGADKGQTLLAEGGGFSSEVFLNIVDKLLESKINPEDIPMGQDKNLDGKLIAVPVEGEELSPHFGHSSSFAFYKLDGLDIKFKDVQMSPKHEQGVIPAWLKENEVNVLIAKNLGTKAEQLLIESGIEVVKGAEAATADEAVLAFAKGELNCEDGSCEGGHEHHGDHSCGGGCH